MLLKHLGSVNSSIDPVGHIQDPTLWVQVQLCSLRFVPAVVQFAHTFRTITWMAVESETGSWRKVEQISYSGIFIVNRTGYTHIDILTTK